MNAYITCEPITDHTDYLVSSRNGRTLAIRVRQVLNVSGPYTIVLADRIRTTGERSIFTARPHVYVYRTTEYVPF